MSSNMQYHIQLKKGDIGRFVLLPGDPGRVPKIAEYLDNPKQISSNREYNTYAGTYKGIPIAVTSTGIGCPSAAIAVEELIEIGADTFIRIGTAGSLQSHVELGDLAITTGAIREDGTSLQYLPLSYPAIADLDVTYALRQAARQLNYRAHTGVGHCKDAFFCEEDRFMPMAEYHKQLWKTWQKAGAISTSMESSAIFTVAGIRGARAGEILAIIGLTWKDTPIMKKVGIDEAIKSALEAIVILDANDKTRV